MNIQMLASYALNVSSDTKYEAFSGEAWAKAGEVTLLGMGMVFAVLAILWAVLAIFKLLFAKDTQGAQSTQSTETKKAVSAPTVAEAPAPAAAAVSDDSELIAVITAAVAAYRASEEGMNDAEAGGFRVVSFKRAANGRAWNSNK